MPPAKRAELWVNETPLAVSVPVLKMAPPSRTALLSVKLLLPCTVNDPLFQTAPPPLAALGSVEWFPLKVVPVALRLAFASLATAPPWSAVFADREQLVRVRLPKLSIAPPLPLPASP